MAELGDREHIDEVEKQFFVGDPGMMPVTPTQEECCWSFTSVLSGPAEMPDRKGGCRGGQGEDNQQDRQFVRIV